ncbi:MAG: DMT family transporter, partial [Rhodospirillaceae bacterium]|nr:DMT family transporter [Rhodospirillaceae bacterium]
MSPSAHASPAITDNLRGAAWMLASAVVFSFVSLAIKAVGQGLPSPEVVFFRCLFGLVVIAPFVVRHGWAVYRTARPGLHVMRLVCATIGMNAGFYATANLELATAISLSYTRPLFMIVIAILFLGEIVRWRRGLATIVGFIGVLVMLGPADIALSPPAIAALVAALATAGAMAVVKSQAATDGPATIMVWFGTGTAILTAIPAA